MSQPDIVVAENCSTEPSENGAILNENTSENSDVILKKEETNTSCQESSPKSRRKISKPKQYKPETDGVDNGNDAASETSECTNEDIVEDRDGSQCSSNSVVAEQQEEVVPENAAHVMTANQEKKKPESKTRQRAVKKQKHETPTIPRKPEDLIRESLSLGQVTPPANKRDAQYRKSYAYKIWKERGSQEVESETTKEKNKPIKKLPPGPLQNQARAAFYWQSNEFNGTAPPGFIANGQYFSLNPQMISPIYGGPQTPQTLPAISHNFKVASVSTSSHVVPTSVLQNSTSAVVSPGVHFSATAQNVGNENKEPISKAGPPNVTVVTKYPSREAIAAKNTPITKTSEGAKRASPPISKADVIKISPARKLDFPAKKFEKDEIKASNASTSNLVSIMKTSLRQKHSKENVQPMNMFKSKRKLETDKGDGPPPKKSGKPTIFTPLNEQEAEKLANDIYDVNLEYFPFQTLAEKAAQNEEMLTETPEKIEKPGRVEEIEKVRCLLRDFYDVTFSCTEDPDMQKFDSASRKFGRKNILNHLSLLDKYFAELQKKLDA